MRIGLFHSDLPQPDRKVGGVSVVVHRLANALAQDSHDQVIVFSLDDPPDDAAYRHVRLFSRFPWLQTNKLARLFLLPALLNFVDFGPLDVLHLHGDDWFFFRRRCVTVRTFHGSALREAQTSTTWRRKLVQRLLFLLESLSARLATVNVAVGEDARGLYCADRCVDNGVDLARFAPGPKDPVPTVLFVGTWHGRKRGQLLRRVFLDTVLPRLPEAQLLMVTDRCDSAPNVTWVRFPDDAALAELYRRAWVFAYPSVYEGFGIPYLEAMASGTAVLASPNTGADYLLDKGRAGLIAADADFGMQLVELLSDQTQRQQYERLGLERAASFSWDLVADRHRAIYRSALPAQDKRPCPQN
jgi:phosphatidylinositol alpha-mannosyltransferase